ncbi:MAG TPA: hypothetical protein VMJ30_02745, partial [Gemmatimonadales bacterium]|nr:hypothetical protein [Gemmatimonadales bacterium]
PDADPGFASGLTAKQPAAEERGPLEGISRSRLDGLTLSLLLAQEGDLPGYVPPGTRRNSPRSSAASAFRCFSASKLFLAILSGRAIFESDAQPA